MVCNFQVNSPIKSNLVIHKTRESATTDFGLILTGIPPGTGDSVAGLPEIDLIVMPPSTLRLITIRSLARLAVITCSMRLLAAREDPSVEERLAGLEQQNALLMQLVKNQQSEIDSLKAQLIKVRSTTENQSEAIEILEDSAFDVPSLPARSSMSDSIHISGEAGVIFRAGEKNTHFPNDEFRVDEARLFIDARIAENVFLFSELEFFTREQNHANLRTGELYLEVENMFSTGDPDRGINLRAGRLNIPFGEEYQTRDVMDNPLISHSVADLWGIDEGVEIFGGIGDLDYVLAVQNGSSNVLRDFTSDKSITARVGFDPSRNLRISGSYMRTGDIDIEKETLTELWIGNGFFRSIGSESTLRFEAELAQADAVYSWQNGHLGVAYGEAGYQDDDTAGNNDRDFSFWHAEAKQEVADNLFAAVRYSGMTVSNGYPLPGMSPRGRYFFGPVLTEELRRLSLGITYWPYPDVVLKLDYTLEDAKDNKGIKRTNNDLLAAEAGLRF